MRKWIDDIDSYTPTPVSVNISRIDIYNPDIAAKIKSIVRKHGIPASMLRLEITESAYMQNPEQLIGAVGELQAEGFIVEMDDFGSGYSSLNTLKDVPVDILKLDMRFLSDGISGERGGNILSSVIRMAHWLKIPVIAEGVETRAQADYLKSLGCFYMQGFFFARPMSAASFENMLRNIHMGDTGRFNSAKLDGVAAFWDASAQNALLFNSFVGGAAILEYRHGNVEILRANDRFYSQLETTREEYLDKQLHTLERFEGVHRVAFVRMLDIAASTEGEAECEVQSLAQDERGRRFWTHNRVKLLANSNDSRLFYIATENITDRKYIEEQLRISRETLQASICRLDRVICGYDIPMHEITMPDEYAAKLGMPSVTRDIHLNCGSILPNDRQRFAAFFERIHSGAPIGSALVRITAVNGMSYTWEQMDFVTVFDDMGNPIRAVITCKDVTGDKEREASKARSSLMLSHVDVCLIDYDVPTDVMSILSSGGEAFPHSMSTYLGGFLDSDGSRIRPDCKEYHRQQLNRIISGKPERGMYELVADIWGTGHRWSRLSYISLGDELGSVYRIIGQITDIQKEKDDAALIKHLSESAYGLGASHIYNAALVEHAFRILHASDSSADAVERVLASIGEYYSLCRIYVFEDSDNHRVCSNTFEWCADDVQPQKQSLQRVSYAHELGGDYQSMFDKNGVLFSKDICGLPETLFISSKHVKSALQCAIMNDGVFEGFIGFSDRRAGCEWQDEQMGTLIVLSQMIGTFIMKLRGDAAQEFSEALRSVLDNNAFYIFSIEPDTFEIVYSNKAIRSAFGESYVGRVCHREFMRLDKPCASCPVRLINESGVSRCVEIERPDGTTVLSQAARICRNGRDLIMITCVDITDRKRP